LELLDASIGNTQYLSLNTTAAAATSTARWNNTSPTSTVFTVATTGSVNDPSNTYVAYCWAEIAGFSRFGSYTGNGSTDGPFVFTGFRPKFFLVKRTDTVESWNIVDTSRNEFNQAGANLYPNLSNAESTNNSCDILSNGIKLRNTWAGAWNGDIKNPKALEDKLETKQDGSPLYKQVYDKATESMVDTTEQVVTKGLKSNFIAQVTDTAGKLLAQTDWYVVRKLERNVDIPAKIVTKRAAIVTEANRLETAITNATSVEALIEVLNAQNWGE